MVDWLCGMLISMGIGLVFFPESVGEMLAQIHKGYRKGMEKW